MPAEIIQSLPPPFVTLTKRQLSPYRKAFQHSPRVEIDGLLTVECFKPVDEGSIPKERKIENSKWVYSCKVGEQGIYMRPNSRLVDTRFIQVQDMGYHARTSPTTHLERTSLTPPSREDISDTPITRGHFRHPHLERTSPTPPSAALKMLAFIVNELDLSVFHLDVSQSFVQAPPEEEEICMRLSPGCEELSGRVVKLLKC